MKKFKYRITALSPVIISARESDAYYKGIDFDEAFDKNIIYPFYHYGEECEYKPEEFLYYIPGSSIKGALLCEKKENARNDLMVDDIQNITFKQIELLELIRASHIKSLFDEIKKNEKQPKFESHFDKIGIHAFNTGNSAIGTLKCSTDIDDYISKMDKNVRRRLELFVEQLKNIKGMTNKFNIDFLEKIESIIGAVNKLKTQKDKKLMFLGGYKGLICSLASTPKDMNELFSKSAIFYEPVTKLPYGIVEVELMKA